MWPILNSDNKKLTSDLFLSRLMKNANETKDANIFFTSVANWICLHGLTEYNMFVKFRSYEYLFRYESLSSQKLGENVYSQV